MKRFLLHAVGALAVLVLPAIGSATQYGPFWWPGDLDGIPAKVSSQRPADWEQSVEIFGANPNQVDACAEGHSAFCFFGQSHDTLKVGSKGYVAFGNTLANLPNPIALGQANPNIGALIAGWWGDHICTGTDLGVDLPPVSGPKGDQRRTIVWSCAKKSGATATTTTFKIAMRLFEDSSVIRVGFISMDKPDNHDWDNVRVGIRDPAASFSKDAGLPCPAMGCKSEHFPVRNVVQFGAWENHADLITQMQEIDGPTLSNNGSDITIGFKGIIQNIGKMGLGNVQYRIYLQTRAEAPNANHVPVFTSTAEDIDPLGIVPFDDEATIARPPSGKYYLCVTASGTGGEKDSRNNWSCSDETFVIGPDLAGTFTKVPPNIKPMMPFEATIRITNKGALPIAASETDKIRFTLDFISDGYFMTVVQPEAFRYLQNKYGAEPFEDFLAQPLDPGESVDIKVRAKVAFMSNNERVEWQLRASIAGKWHEDSKEITDGDSSNNTFLSAPITLLVPTYEITWKDLDLPFECTYGEPARGEVEICNREGGRPGAAEGYAFSPKFAFTDVGSGANTWSSGLGPSALQYCSEPRQVGSTWQMVDEDAHCAEGSLCALGDCWELCDATGDWTSGWNRDGCGEGFVCGEAFQLQARLNQSATACVPYVAPGACVTYRVEGKVPHESWEPHSFGNLKQFQDGARYTPRIAPAFSPTPESMNTSDLVFDDLENGLVCHVPKPELSPKILQAPLEVVAGESFRVERRITNDGALATDFEYAYRMAPHEFVTLDQYPIPVTSSSSGIGTSSVQRKVLTEAWTTVPGLDYGFDVVQVPDIVQPGLYYLGLLVDPFDKVLEPSKQNNIHVYEKKIRVHPAILRIETHRLANGTVGMMYNESLWASGGTGVYRWEKGKNFPSWLHIDPATGHLSGTPTEERDYLISVNVRSGGVTATKNLALRVVEAHGQLAIPAHVLPLATWEQPYSEVALTANGGKPPYRWFIGQNEKLPTGMCFKTPEGIVSSACREDGSGSQPIPRGTVSRSFVVGVEDARGARATRELRIHVSSGAELRIKTDSLMPATLGTPYSQSFNDCITAEGGSEENFLWSLSSLPAGLTYRVQSDRACVEGMPKEWGLFMVEASVTDAGGLKATKAIRLEVSRRHGEISLTPNDLGSYLQGANLDEKLTVGGIFDDNETYTMTILQGRLPSGVELTSDGWVQGTIANSAEPGIYTVAVEIRTAYGRLDHGTLSITVKQKAREVKKTDEPTCGGASVAGGSPSSYLPLALALLGLVTSVRTSRRRNGGAN